MARKLTIAKAKFRVVCVWCGSEIREDKHEDEQGVCLKCFYRMLGDHLTSQRRSRAGEFVSER
jgi:DNA-directed RNA polymerase subunit RPC12/RpoP